MAAERCGSACEKTDFELHSPQSVLTGDTLGTPASGATDGNYDCEAATSGRSKRKQQWLPRFPLLRSQTTADIEETKIRKLEENALGYPRLAAFLSSESSFSLYRGFDYLHSRVILDLQAEISQLEKELDAHDRRDLRNGDTLRLQSRAEDIVGAEAEGQDRTRQEILSDIRRKLVEYDELLVKAQALASFQRPSNRDYRSVRTWFHNLKPLVDSEQAFIKCKEDIVTLRHGREWSGFDGFVEGMLQKLHCAVIRKIFCTPELREKTSDEFVYYYSQSRVDVLVGLILTGTVFVLLVLPVFAMYRLTSFGERSSTFDAIGVLVVFTLLFAAAMSLMTKARRHELFAASAGYCAVLVVFISNFGGSAGAGVQGG